MRPAIVVRTARCRSTPAAARCGRTSLLDHRLVQASGTAPACRRPGRPRSPAHAPSMRKPPPPALEGVGQLYGSTSVVAWKRPTSPTQHRHAVHQSTSATPCCRRRGEGEGRAERAWPLALSAARPSASASPGQQPGLVAAGQPSRRACTAVGGGAASSRLGSFLVGDDHDAVTWASPRREGVDEQLQLLPAPRAA